MFRIRTTRRILTALAIAACVATVVPAASAAPQGVVNVNSAGAAELMLLPRIGPAVAERIIEFREANGDFASAEELLLVRGIGEATFDRLKPFVTVKGETTLAEKVPSGSASSSEVSSE